MILSSFRSLFSLLLIASLIIPVGQANSGYAATPAEKKVIRDTRFSLVDETSEARGAEYVMRRFPGEQLIAVKILSGVKAPGIYYMPEGTDLLTAVALAGGLTSTADSSRIHLNQWATQSHHLIDLGNVVEEPKKRNPVLAANDIFMVDENKPVVSTNTVLVITVIASLIGVALGARALTK